jgi:hypothetical protein
MPKFPVDVPKSRLLQALESLGFRMVREGNHIALERQNSDGSRTPLTMPNHRTMRRNFCSLPINAISKSLSRKRSSCRRPVNSST